MGFVMELAGFVDWQQATSELSAAVDEAFTGAYWVGTIVVYAPYLEFGTRKMLARPFFKPAIFRLARRMEGVSARSLFGTASGEAVWGLIVDEQTPLRVVAAELEREVNNVIKSKGLILTGNLRASIAFASGEEAMFRKSLANALDPGSAVGAG